MPHLDSARLPRLERQIPLSQQVRLSVLMVLGLSQYSVMTLLTKDWYFTLDLVIMTLHWF